MTTTALAGACLLGAAGLVDLRHDGTEQRAAASEPSPATTVSSDRTPPGESLAAEVAELDPLVASAGARRCLAAGPACAPDDLLDVDTTRLRADAVATALRPPDAGTTSPLVAQADGLSHALGQWLTDGCGGSIDGVAVTGPVPDSCAASGTAAGAALDRWVTTIRRWTAARSS